MSRSAIKLTINSRQLLETQRRAPGVANEELNAGLAHIAGGFYDKFLPRLQGAGITVHRGLTERQTAISKLVPADARAMGFTAKMDNEKEIRGKRIRLWSRSPVMKAHEFGATISGHPFLAIGEPHRFGSKGAMKETGRLKTGRLIRLVRSVTIKPRLGFYMTWMGYQSEAQKRADEIVTRVVERTVEMSARLN